MSEKSHPKSISIRSPEGTFTIPLESGSTVTFCGANGSGKTRLAVYIEDQLGLTAHRISAHRALSLNPHVEKIGEQQAISGLRTGAKDGISKGRSLPYRLDRRWGNKKAVYILNDFDFLLQALFAEQTNTALNSHNQIRSGMCGIPDPTKFEKLAIIWEKLLPHRILEISGYDIKVRDQSEPKSVEETYSASEMSDGERAIFYLIGQTLVASENSVLVIDEPELHLHPAITTSLWDELSSVRPDCVFLLITHNLEFAASRPGLKYIINEFHPTPGWTLQEVPQDVNFNEDFVTLILGSRQPVLFIEGNTSTSLDRIIYRSCYPDHLVVPLESSGAVIHAVASMKQNAAFTRVNCQGVIDRDHRTEEEIEYLRSRNVHVLPVAEIENILLLPDVSRVIAEIEGYEGENLEARLQTLRDEIFGLVTSGDNLERAVLRWAKREIDRRLKKIDLRSPDTADSLIERYKDITDSIDISDITARARETIQSSIDNRDLSTLLAHFDNKGMFALAAQNLKNTKAKEFGHWLERILTNGSNPALTTAIQSSLPDIPIEQRNSSNEP